MKIVIPMLGRGSKFIQAGVKEPKFLVSVKGQPLFAWAIKAIDYLDIERDAIFLINQEHIHDWHLDRQIRKVVGPQATFIPFDYIPEGAAKTVLLVRDKIDNEQELIIYNADQFFTSAKLPNLLKETPPEIDGIISTFHATHPKWSYVQTDDADWVTHVAEKEPISTKATVGFYFFKHGADFVWAADQMITKQLMVGNEYYVCPAYNELIANGKKIKAIPVEEMWGLGTPEDVDHFEKYYKGHL